MTSRTAFVTGGTGFLGTHIVEALRETGWKVIALHRAGSDVTRLKNLGVELRQGDITQPESLLHALPAEVDAVFHAAAAVSLWSVHAALLQRANVEGTRNMVAAALAKGARRFIHTSSTSVYGNLPGKTMSEKDPRAGLASPIAYLRTKAQAEIEVETGMGRGLDAVILQPTYAIGRYDSKNWGRLFRVIRDGKTGGTPIGAGSFIHAAAVGRAHVAAAVKGRKGARYILSTTPASYHELFKEAEGLLGISSRLRPAPPALVTTMAWLFQGLSLLTRRAPELTPEVAHLLNHAFYYDGRLAMDELGVEGVDIRSMLKDCHDWLKTQGGI